MNTTNPITLTDANLATFIFSYDPATHTATFDYSIGNIEWDARKDFFDAIATINLRACLCSGDEAFTDDCNTPFYIIDEYDEDGDMKDLCFVIGQQTLHDGLVWVKHIYNSTIYAERKAAAEQEAIEWLSDFANHNYSYDELAEWADYFRKLGKKYGLLREFRENGIC